MAASIPTTEPTSLRAGNTWQWRREDLSDYPAGTWTLTYYFRNSSSHFNVVASADGDAFAVSVAVADSAKAPGWYDWVAVVTDGTNQHDVDAGRMEVLPDWSASQAADGRIFARKMLDYIEAALLDRASGDQLDLINAALADRSMARDRGGLIALRSQMKAEIAREEHAANLRKGLGGKNRLLARFA